MRILFLPGSYTAPSARYRVLQFARPLRDLGHEVTVRVIRPERSWRSFLPGRGLRRVHNLAGTLMRLGSAAAALRDVERFDVVLLHRDLLPEMRIEALEPRIARRNPRVIFDFDDAIYLGSRDAKLRKILPCFAAATAGNETLAAYARQWNGNVVVLPTVVDTGYYRPANVRAEGSLRIGWTGSEGPMNKHLPLVEPVVQALAREYDFEFVVISGRPPAWQWPGIRLRFIRWDPKTETEDLQKIDIGLMPLPDGPFEAGKCGAKAILHMAAGAPVVASPVGVNRQIVVHGETGFHCTGEGEWRDALATLLHDEKLRHRMGKAGRDRAVALYSQRAVLPRMVSLFAQVAALPAAMRPEPPRALRPVAVAHAAPAGTPMGFPAGGTKPRGGEVPETTDQVS